MDTTEANKNSFQRFPPKPHSLATQTIVDSCQQHLDTFFSTFEKLRIDLLLLIGEYEKLLRGTSIELGVRNFKDAVSWIFEPVQEKTLSLSATVKTAFSELSDVMAQRNRAGKEPASSRLSNGNETAPNGIEHARLSKKISRQEINLHKVRLLQPCVEQLIDLLAAFFQKGEQIYSLQEQATPQSTTPSEQDLNQLPVFFPSLPQILQVPTAHWFVASQTSAEMRQQDFPLTAPDPVFTRQQLQAYVQFLEKTPFKRFQVMGGFQCNPSDMCRALERCATEEELAQLSEYFQRRGEEVREGMVECEMPRNTSYIIGDREISSEEGTNKINFEIEQLCDSVCEETAANEAKKRLAEFVTYEVCSDILEKSCYVSVLLLYGKAYLVDIAEFIADGCTNKITISRLEDTQGVKVEEVRTWKIVPSNTLENWNVLPKDPLATLETCYKKDFQLATSDNSFILETVDVKILTINHGLGLDKQDTTAPLLSQPRHAPTHRTYSLPIESVDFMSDGEREKTHSRHASLQHTMSLHFSEDTGMRGHPSNLGNSRSKTGSLESISSVSTLKAINPDFGLSADAADDIRQQLFQDTTFQHLQNRKWTQPQGGKTPDAWPREEDHFFLNLFSKNNQDMNTPNQKEEKKAPLPHSPSKDKSLRVHRRNFSVDSSQIPGTGAPPGKHQSVSNLASISSENTPAGGDISQHWMSSLSTDNLTKCQSWPSLCGVIEMDTPGPSKEPGTAVMLHPKDRGAGKLEDSIDSSHMNTIYNPYTIESTAAKEFHCSDSELWPSKGIWGDEGLGDGGSSKKLPRSVSLSSDSESCASDSDSKETFIRPKELTRAKYKPVYSENKPSKSKHPFSRPPPFSPANSPQPRPIYHQPSPPPPHWEPPRNSPHPPHPPPGWNGTHWHEGAPPMHMPPMHGPHPPGQWGPPPPPHHHPLSHPPHQGPPPHPQQFPYHSAPPPPHYPPPIGLHSTPSPLPVPPEPPRAPPPLPPHQGIHPPTSSCPPHSPQIPPPTPPRPNSPVPPNQQYPPYGIPIARSLMDPNHPHNQCPPLCPPPYYMQRMPHPHHNYYPIPNTNW